MGVVRVLLLLFLALEPEISVAASMHDIAPDIATHTQSLNTERHPTVQNAEAISTLQQSTSGAVNLSSAIPNSHLFRMEIWTYTAFALLFFLGLVALLHLPKFDSVEDHIDLAALDQLYEYDKLDFKWGSMLDRPVELEKHIANLKTVRKGLEEKLRTAYIENTQLGLSARTRTALTTASALLVSFVCVVSKFLMEASGLLDPQWAFLVMNQVLAGLLGYIVDSNFTAAKTPRKQLPWVIGQYALMMTIDTFVGTSLFVVILKRLYGDTPNEVESLIATLIANVAKFFYGTFLFGFFVMMPPNSTARKFFLFAMFLMAVVTGFLYYKFTYQNVPSLSKSDSLKFLTNNPWIACVGVAVMVVALFLVAWKVVQPWAHQQRIDFINSLISKHGIDAMHIRKYKTRDPESVAQPEKDLPASLPHVARSVGRTGHKYTRRQEKPIARSDHDE